MSATMTHPGDPFVAALDIAQAPVDGDPSALEVPHADPTPSGGADVHARVRAALEHARRTRDAQVLSSLAPSTLAAYARDWHGFVRWCAEHAVIDPSLVPLPVTDATLSTWVGSLDRLRPTSVGRKLAAVRLVHRWAALPIDDTAIPLTLAAVRGHARRHAHVPPRRVRAATGDLVWRLADACQAATPTGLRNRALILVGFDAALRSGELVALDHEHLTRTPDGLALALPRSKADQTGRGAVVSVAARPGSPWCPVAALNAWITASGRTTGAVFVGARRGQVEGGGPVARLSARAVARAVRAAAKAAGLATDEANAFSSHSLRRGQITTALDAGAPLDDVMRHARHGSPRSTLVYHEITDAVRRQPRVAIGPSTEASGAGRPARADTSSTAAVRSDAGDDGPDHGTGVPGTGDAPHGARREDRLAADGPSAAVGDRSS